MQTSLFVTLGNHSFIQKDFPIRGSQGRDYSVCVFTRVFWSLTKSKPCSYQLCEVCYDDGAFICILGASRWYSLQPHLPSPRTRK